ncbi:hypothetical protein P4O66_017165, partial [Electrophorus voltai]
SNPSNVKRTWQQVKVKYKNIVQCANRKRAQKQRLGGGLAMIGFTRAEEQGLLADQRASQQRWHYLR